MTDMMKHLLCSQSLHLNSSEHILPQRAYKQLRTLPDEVQEAAVADMCDVVVSDIQRRAVHIVYIKIDLVVFAPSGRDAQTAA